jgi:phospholipase C
MHASIKHRFTALLVGALTAGGCLGGTLTPVGPSPRSAEAAPEVVIGPRSSDIVELYKSNLGSEPKLSHEQKLKLLQKKIKYVFVLFQENRSFDFHLGTFPGADGLFSQPAARTPGFEQAIVDVDGKVGKISPFLITATVQNVKNATVPLYPADTDSVDHSHAGIDNSLDLVDGVPRNDRYALNEEGLTTKDGKIVVSATGLPLSAASYPTLAQKQKGELVMAHIDCDTVPFLWQYADRFALFDNFHQSTIGPSTPNAIAMIAGQSGETQWALHPDEGSNNTAIDTIALSGGEPDVGDLGPFAGSNLDTSPVKPPYGLNDESPAKPALNQTYASLPLSFMGKNIQTTIGYDQNPALDLLDVQADIREIASRKLQPVNWGWYQQGYDHEPTDSAKSPTGSNYIVHHDGPQYFGYVGDNTLELKNLHGLADFFSDVAAARLSAEGGVYYVRGGYGNNDGLAPLDPNPAVQANFPGNDDHPGYSDAQISEALLADEINAITQSPYWSESAIIIAYDETDGLYDHTLSHIRSFDPEGSPLAGGPRIPAIVISPYGRAHAISHEYAEHSSVIKFINELFGLTALGDLPDEVRGRALGLKEFGQKDLGPADTVEGMGDLFSAFDNGRLSGKVPRLPAEYAAIPAADVKSLPHYGGHGCYNLNIVPTDYRNGKLIDPPPADFNPRPGTTPGLPTSASWTP